MKITCLFAFSTAFMLTLTAAATAATSYNVDVDVYDTSGPDFISGSGIPINGFAQDNLLPAGQSISVALKARDRDTGQANANVGNRYFEDPGFSSTSPALTNLSIDFQFDPGVDGSTNYVLRQSIDFDPAYGATDFAVITLPIFDADGIPDATVDSWIDTDGYFTNPGAGAWNDDTVPYVISNSTRLDFAFWALVFGKTYDPNATGEYELRLEVLEPTGAPIAGVTAYAEIVPEPATIALLSAAMFGLGVFTVRRPRRS